MEKRSHHRKGGYAQLNMHIDREDALLVDMVEKARMEGIPLATIGEAGLRWAWKNVHDQVVADAKELMTHRQSAPMWAIQVRDEAARIKQENEQLKLQLARLRK